MGGGVCLPKRATSSAEPLDVMTDVMSDVMTVAASPKWPSNPWPRAAGVRSDAD